MKMNHILNQNDFYKCSDLSLATTISLHFPIEAIDRQNPRKAEFLFARNQELDNLVESYWRGELRVEPQNFFNQLRIIKTRLYGME